VGGIPEILPDSMLVLAKPSVKDLVDKLEFAIERHLTGRVMDPLEQHERIQQMYNWRDVARRTMVVYDLVEGYKIVDNSLVDKLTRFKRCGYVGFYAMAFIFLCDFILIQILEFFNPKSKIDLAPNVNEIINKEKIESSENI
jgi:phosphatidylinositol glycan class A protein